MFAEGEGEGTGWIGSLWLIDAHSGIGSGKAVGSGCSARGTVSSHLRQNMIGDHVRQRVVYVHVRVTLWFNKN